VRGGLVFSHVHRPRYSLFTLRGEGAFAADALVVDVAAGAEHATAIRAHAAMLANVDIFMIGLLFTQKRDRCQRFDNNPVLLFLLTGEPVTS